MIFWTEAPECIARNFGFASSTAWFCQVSSGQLGLYNGFRIWRFPKIGDIYGYIWIYTPKSSICSWDVPWDVPVTIYLIICSAPMDGKSPLENPLFKDPMESEPLEPLEPWPNWCSPLPSPSPLDLPLVDPLHWSSCPWSSLVHRISSFSIKAGSLQTRLLRHSDIQIFLCTQILTQSFWTFSRPSFL